MGWGGNQAIATADGKEVRASARKMVSPLAAEESVLSLHPRRQVEFSGGRHDLVRPVSAAEEVEDAGGVRGRSGDCMAPGPAASIGGTEEKQEQRSQRPRTCRSRSWHVAAASGVRERPRGLIEVGDDASLI